MSNDEFRASQAERRAAGLKARHETREARAIRRQVAEEIAQAIEAFFPDPHTEDEECSDCLLAGELAKLARKIGTSEASA